MIVQKTDFTPVCNDIHNLTVSSFRHELPVPVPVNRDRQLWLTVPRRGAPHSDDTLLCGQSVRPMI